tara:strand:- start:378 stop:956 length:579 start_codon:yes stop_codon:yes gene_type:complete
MRALAVQLPGLGGKQWDERRAYPPGMHGLRRKKDSLYGSQLKEKQKLRYNYGVLEKQFRSYVRESFRLKGDASENLIILLESRLDNAIFRAGFANSIPHARQLVSHGHIQVDGKRINIPSFQVKVGMEFTLSEKAQKMASIEACLQQPAMPVDWVETDAAKKVAKVMRSPSRESLCFPVHMPSVVEYYSRLV